MISILCTAGYTFSTLTSQICFCIGKEALDHTETNENDCVPSKFYLWGLPFWSRGYTLPLQGAWVQFLVRELRSCTPHGGEKKKKQHTLLIKQITGQIWSDGHSLKILDPPITNKFSRIFHSPFVFSGCDLEVNLIILLFFF